MSEILNLNDKWFYRIGTQVHGPIPNSELKNRAALGTLRPDTLVRMEGEEWRRADHVYFLSASFGAPEKSEEWWGDLQRASTAEEVLECRNNLLQLFVCSFLLAAVLVIAYLLDSIGPIQLEGSVGRIFSKGFNQAFGGVAPIGILVFGAGIVRSLFKLLTGGIGPLRELKNDILKSRKS